jgi:hypothetical protein
MQQLGKRAVAGARAGAPLGAAERALPRAGVAVRRAHITAPARCARVGGTASSAAAAAHDGAGGGGARRLVVSSASHRAALFDCGRGCRPWRAGGTSVAGGAGALLVVGRGSGALRRAAAAARAPNSPPQRGARAYSGGDGAYLGSRTNFGVIVVPQQQAFVMERFGKFAGVSAQGPWQRGAGRGGWLLTWGWLLRAGA